MQSKVLSSKPIKYDDIDFVLNEVQILDTLRNNDNLQKNQKISVLQTKDVNTLLNKNSEMILYIEKYKGPITQDAYVIVGHDYGQYVINQKDLKKVDKNSDKIKTFNVDYNSIDQLKEKIKNVPYKSTEQRRAERMEQS